MSNPVRQSYSREEMLTEARVWMCNTFEEPTTLKGEAKEQWYVRLGILADFISDMFPDGEGRR